MIFYGFPGRLKSNIFKALTRKTTKTESFPTGPAEKGTKPKQ